MTQKKFFLTSVLFFLLSYLVLYFNPGVVEMLKAFLNTSDFLTPFTVFNIFLTKNSSPDYVFGGYAPFFDLLVGLIFWLITRNTQLTMTLYAIYQPILITACLLYLVYCLVGRNWKMGAIMVIFSAIPILVFSTGHLPTIYYLFGWHIHVETIGAGFIGLGALVLYTTHQPQDRQLFSSSLLLVAVVTVLTVFCDPSFISQFIAPAITLLFVMFLVKVISFRRAAYAGLTLLYGTAGGLALYQLPRLWGSDRIILNGSVVTPVFDRIVENVPLLIWNITDLFEHQIGYALIWALFFVLCIAGAWSIFRQRKSAGSGAIRTRLFLVLVFLPLQMLISIMAALTAVGDPAFRYFLPSIFMPLFWGWPILLILKADWLRWLNVRKVMVLGYSIVALALVLIGINAAASSAAPLPDLTTYYPKFTACLDENAIRLDLHRGIAHYWQARQNTILSKQGLVIAQVYPDLKPVRYLNNSDSYRGDFDFVIIDNKPPQANWVDREVVLARYGQPATSFTCGNSDILVYNRPQDYAFRQQFVQFLAEEDK